MVRSFAMMCGLAAILALAASAARAEERYGLSVESGLVIDPGRDVTRTDTVEGRVVNGAALKRLGQWTVSYNRTYEAVDIVEALTLKADGRSLAVPPERILTSDMGPVPGPMFFPDTRLVTVIFPDLAVGDRTRLVLKRTVSRPFDAYSESLTLPPWLPLDSLTLTVDRPDDGRVAAEARDMAVEARREGGRLVERFVYAGAPYREPGELDVEASDWAPRVVVSEFGSWDQLGRMFLQRADGPSRPTPAVAALAQTVAGHLDDPAARARAVFAHVAREFRYTGVYLGAGGIVPNAADDVIARRYGDCKDLSSLTRAMLAALGIEADFVLVHGDPTYALPALPVLAAFNHVVLHVPALDLWFDATDGRSTPGVLPVRLAGKPGLGVGRAGTRVLRTPDPVPSVERLSSQVLVGGDGTVSVALALAGTGAAAAHVHDLLDVVEAKGGEAAGQDFLGRGARGGTMVLAPGEGAGTVTARAVLNARAFAEAVTLPSTLGLSGGSWRLLRKAAAESQQRAVVCRPETLDETITVSWPAERKLATVPRNGEVTVGGSRYTARYRVEGASLVIERSLRLDPGGPVCDRATLDRLAPVLNAVARHEGVRLRFDGVGGRTAARDAPKTRRGSEGTGGAPARPQDIADDTPE